MIYPCLLHARACLMHPVRVLVFCHLSLSQQHLPCPCWVIAALPIQRPFSAHPQLVYTCSAPIHSWCTRACTCDLLFAYQVATGCTGKLHHKLYTMHTIMYTYAHTQQQTNYISQEGGNANYAIQDSTPKYAHGLE